MKSSWLAEIEAQPAEREALRFEGAASSFGELAQNVSQLLGDFDRAELTAVLQSGERIALLAPPCAAGVVFIHACLERGVVMVPLNLRWTDDEILFAVRASGAKTIVVSTETEAAGNRIAALQGCGLLRMSGAAQLGAKIEILRPQRTASQAPEASGRNQNRDWVVAQAGALLLFTSGTSGRPKAALLSEGNLRASARAQIELLGRDADDRWLCCMPLFHIGGLSILVRSVLAGTCVVLHPNFDPEAVSCALDQDRITRVSWVATMLSRVLDFRGDRPAPEALELVLLGGGPASNSLLERAIRLGYPLAPTYGLTEAASQVATRPPGRVLEAGTPLSCGLEPLPGTQIRIVDKNRSQLAPGIAGEIEVRGPTVMRGYLGDPEATRAALRDGWLVTGDMGVLDAHGRLQVLDRRSDLIVSGGENVYPAEIESVLAACPGVLEAAVVGVPDAEFGARAHAFVVRSSEATIDASSVVAFCRARLAGYKVPRSVEFIEALPRTSSGKLMRRALAETLR